MGGKSVATAAQKLGDISLQTSCYGIGISFFYGQVRGQPNLVYYNGFKAIPHTTTTPGKGGGKNSNTTYTYQVDAIFSCGEGPVEFIEVFNDKDVLTLGDSGFTFFPGALDQPIWPYLQSTYPQDAYNYSGTALACQAKIQLDETGTLGNYSFHMRNTDFSIPAGLPGSPDCNPADYIPDFLNNALYGAISGALFDDLTPLRIYTTAMNFVHSPEINEQKGASDYLKDFLTACNSEVITSGNKLKFIPYGDVPVTNNGASWVPNTTPEYDLGPNDFIVDAPGDDPIKIKRANPKETYNCIPVEFEDRARQYNTNTASVAEPVDAATYGLRTDQTETLHMIKQYAVAQAISLILAQRSIYQRNEYTLSLPYRFCLLEPMDLVTLTEPKIGFSRKTVRLTKLKENGSNGRLDLTVIEWPFGMAHATAYSTQSSDVAPINQAVLPGNINTPVIFDYPTYLTSNGSAAIGAAASGGQWWGGCDVWMSADNASYQFVGRIDRPGRYGTLTAAYGNNGAYDTTHTLAIDDNVSNAPQLLGVSADYNADFANLALIDNELVSYQNATLTGVGRYNLTNIYRGALGTTGAAHSSGARFVRMDDATIEIPITPARIGTTLYLKFASFNIFGKSTQQLSDINPYAFVPNPGWDVTNTSDQFTVTGTINGIAFTWGLGLLPGAYVVELYEGSTNTAYAGGTATMIWSGNATGKLIPKADTTTRYYWIRARAQDGRYGPLVPSGNGLPGKASFVTSAMVLGVSPGSATASVGGTSGTTNSVTVTPVGGTPAYTYAWTFLSGGSGISIGSASAATTSFTSTGLALHETRTGTAKCHVTDTASNAQDIFVNVEISNAATAPVASALPTTVSVSGAAASETTTSTTVTASGGLAPYTYAWTWVLGGTSITINSASAATTAFSNGAMTNGQTLTGTARCTVTDALSQHATVDVKVSLTRTSPVTLTMSPGSLSVTAPAANQTTGSATATAAFGHSPYTYAWTWLSGGSGIGINTPTAAATSFTANALSASGETRSGVARCTVTDALGGTATADISVAVHRTVVSMSCSASPGTLSMTGTGIVLSAPATVSVTGGSPGYTYAWVITSGAQYFSINAPTASSTTFNGHDGTPGDVQFGSAQCTVRDANGLTATCSVTLKITNPSKL